MNPSHKFRIWKAGCPVCKVPNDGLHNETCVVGMMEDEIDRLTTTPTEAASSSRCESCGYTESHDPNCPRPREVPEPTEEMVEAGARAITSLVASYIIEAPRLLEWQPWAGASRAILRAALSSNQSPLALKSEPKC